MSGVPKFTSTFDLAISLEQLKERAPEFREMAGNKWWLPIPWCKPIKTKSLRLSNCDQGAMANIFMSSAAVKLWSSSIEAGIALTPNELI